MSIDIQKQINFRAQNNNVINAPQQFTNEQVQQPVDEEKSNASKWMIGLTATAAIVIGGIWAAKKGHLGESAQKYANKLFGSTDSVKPKPETGSSTTSSTAGTGSSTSAGATTTTSSSSSTTASAAASVVAVIPPLVVGRKAISKLIKSPKNLTETIQSLNDAGAKVVKEDNRLTVSIGKKSKEDYLLSFDENGLLDKIFKYGKNNSTEVFEFKNGSLKSISRFFNGKSKHFAPLAQKVTFDDNRKVAEEIWDVAENSVLDLKTIKSIPDVKNSFSTTRRADWHKFFSNHFDELPPRIKKIKIFKQKDSKCITDNYDNASYLTARVSKYMDKSFAELPKEIPAEELARCLHKPTDKNFDELVELINTERNIAYRVKDVSPISSKTPSTTVVNDYYRGKFNDINKLSEQFKLHFGEDKTGKKAEIFTKLLKDDLGSAGSFNEKTIISAAESYSAKFKAYGLNNDVDLMEIAVKPLKECSFNELMNILNVVNPRKELALQEPFESAAKEKEWILKYIEKISGRVDIDENTKIFDILKDIS